MKENLVALDGLRGLSALYILIHHARLVLTQSYHQGLNIHPEKYEWYDKVMVYFFSLFKFGHEAVIVFFVLSGFLIHLRQAKPNINFSEFKVFVYLKKRIIRIYPTVLVSFFLCIVCDYITYLLTNATFISIFSKYDFYSFFSNLLLIPNAYIWGNNFPIWSLKHEWFFYMLYPLLLWLAQKHISFPFFIVIGLYLSYLLGFQIPYIGAIAYTLMVWVLGCLLAEIYQNKDSIFLKNLSYLVLLSVLYFFIDKSKPNYPISDILFGLIVMGILAYIIVHKNNIANQVLAKAAWLGTFSFSLYLLHWPLLNLYKSIILHYQTNNRLPYHLWHVVLSIAITIPIIYIIYYYTERLAINYKKKI